MPHSTMHGTGAVAILLALVQGQTDFEVGPKSRNHYCPFFGCVHLQGPMLVVHSCVKISGHSQVFIQWLILLSVHAIAGLLVYP